jgi:hypothetical protein
MIEVRPLNSVRTAGDRDPIIATFADSEWWDLLELARRYGFEPPSIEIHYPRPYGHPVQIDAQTSQDLWESMSAVYNDDAVPYATTWEESTETSSYGRVEIPGAKPEDAHISREAAHEHPEFHVGKVQVERLVACAEIGAEQGGIEIMRLKDED